MDFKGWGPLIAVVSALTVAILVGAGAFRPGPDGSGGPIYEYQTLIAGGAGLAYIPSAQKIDFIPPLAPTLVDEPPAGDNWIHGSSTTVPDARACSSAAVLARLAAAALTGPRASHASWQPLEWQKRAEGPPSKKPKTTRYQCVVH
jgi:hypothetical protein